MGGLATWDGVVSCKYRFHSVNAIIGSLGFYFEFMVTFNRKNTFCCKQGAAIKIDKSHIEITVIDNDLCDTVNW